MVGKGIEGGKMRLVKTGDAKGASFYKGDDGQAYQVRAVNREYAGRKKPPVFYLERLVGEKPVYISGLFPTPKPDTFSYDLKDAVTGIRVMYDARFRESGEVLELQKRTI
jgi:hypothetical protein